MDKIFVIFLASFFAITPEVALAYFDPGSGSMLIQALVALVGGFFIFFKGVRMKLTALFSRDREEEPPQEEDRAA